MMIHYVSCHLIKAGTLSPPPSPAWVEEHKAERPDDVNIIDNLQKPLITWEFFLQRSSIKYF